MTQFEHLKWKYANRDSYWKNDADKVIEALIRENEAWQKFANEKLTAIYSYTSPKYNEELGIIEEPY